MHAGSHYSLKNPVCLWEEQWRVPMPPHILPAKSSCGWYQSAWYRIVLTCRFPCLNICNVNSALHGCKIFAMLANPCILLLLRPAAFWWFSKDTSNKNTSCIGRLIASQGWLWQKHCTKCCTSMYWCGSKSASLLCAFTLYLYKSESIWFTLTTSTIPCKRFLISAIIRVMANVLWVYPDLDRWWPATEHDACLESLTCCNCNKSDSIDASAFQIQQTWPKSCHNSATTEAFWLGLRWGMLGLCCHHRGIWLYKQCCPDFIHSMPVDYSHRSCEVKTKLTTDTGDAFRRQSQDNYTTLDHRRIWFSKHTDRLATPYSIAYWIACPKSTLDKDQLCIYSIRWDAIMKHMIPCWMQIKEQLNFWFW